MIYEDDLSIRDHIRLFRRIHPDWIVWDENLNCYRPSSQAFNDSKDGSPMSVHREDILEGENREPGIVLAGFNDWALAALSAGTLRQNKQGIASDPLPDDRSHALVFGPKPPKVRKRIAKASEWAIRPDK